MKTLCRALLASLVLSALLVPFSTAQMAQSRERIVYSFCSQTNCSDGGYPMASLLEMNGALYGTTSAGGRTNCSCGTVFSLDPSTGAEAVLYSFCSRMSCKDGANPRASLIDVNGTLYGTTESGGSGASGTVFSLDPSTGAETVLYSFCSKQNCKDGAAPVASLIDVNGYLYGTTAQGGAKGHGTVFSLDPSTGAERVLHSFEGSPVAGLIDVNGTLYGTTEGNGYAGGSVFSIDLGTGKEALLHAFEGSGDGQVPTAGLIYANGTLYGTTTFGGETGQGTIFALDPKTGTETVLYSFCTVYTHRCRDGALPQSGLLKLKHKLYGATYFGGRNHGRGGVVFSFDLSTGTETVVYSFCRQDIDNCTDGENPLSSLIDVNGVLYGTTFSGGHAGTVYSLDPATGTLFWVNSR